MGVPLNLDTIIPEDLIEYQENTPVTAILSRTNLWYFPVMLKNEAKTILVVDQIEGEWQAVSLGNTNLAKTLVAITQHWQASEGFNPKLIAVFQANQYLLAVPEVNTKGLISLSTSATDKERVRENSADGMVMENSFEVIKRLKSIVSDNINNN